MHFPQPPTLLSLLFTILSTTHTAHARPKITNEFRELLESRYHYLAQRDCANPCGWREQGAPAPLCCGSGQTCGTNAQGQAVCNSGGGGTVGNAQGQSQGQGQGQQAGWEYYTTTIVESGLVTRTTTYSRSFGAEQTAGVAAAQVSSGSSCNTAMGEKPCGGICCATGQYCVYAGQCGASGSDGDGSSSILGVIFTPPATNTAPLRPTSNVATTITSIGSATTTVAFSTPTSAAASASGAAAAAGVSSSNNGLSAGAIAGIVIGVLAGIVILLLLIFCCCAATAGNALLAFFGLGKKKRRREDVTYIEEHRHHHGSSGAAAVGGRRWFGMGPARVDKPKKKKKSGVGGLTAVTGGLATLAVILGLKRRSDRKQKSEYGSTYYSSDYSYSYDTSESSRSDDRYTRRSGRSAPRR